MARIVLIRPGSTDFDRQGRIQGTLNIPLSDEGRQEVAQMIPGLQPLDLETIYCSPCRAAVETGEILVAAIDARLKKIDKLVNLNHGLWQGMCVEEVRQRQPKVYRGWQEQPESICPPGGESPHEAWHRVEAAMGRICRKHKRETVGLIVPEPLASIVRSHLRHTALGDLWQSPSSCGRFEILEVPGHNLVTA